MRTLLRAAGSALGALLLVVPAAAVPFSSSPVVPAAGVPFSSSPVVPAAAGVRSAIVPAAVPIIRPGVVSVASHPRAAAGPPLAGSVPDSPAAGGSPGSPVVGDPATRFGWPLAGTPRPVRRFDPPRQPWLPGHRGVDLAATPGVEVRAAGPGVVLFAGVVAGRPVVTVGHADGLRTTYEPVRPRLPVGTRVALGAPVGTLLAGHPDCAAEACLHWGLRRGQEYLDPLALLGLGQVRLLPLDPAMPGSAQP